VVVFVNGLPLALIELKNAADEEANTLSAFKDLQTYKAQIPSMFLLQRSLCCLRWTRYTGGDDQRSLRALHALAHD
jgi:hypothetical protein